MKVLDEGSVEFFVLHFSLFLTRLTNELDLFLSKFFGVQLATSALCICGSIFCIVFVSRFSYLCLQRTPSNAIEKNKGLKNLTVYQLLKKIAYSQ